MFFRPLAVLATSLVVMSAPALGATVLATAELDGLQEVPANDSTATGAAAFTFDEATGDYTFTLSVVGIDAFEINADVAGGIHIHEAAPGFNGPIVINTAEDRVDLIVSDFGEFVFVAEGTVSAPASIFEALAAGNLYVNVHTEEFPGGEIRGQLAIVPVPGALLLFGSAFTGLITVSRRRGVDADAA
jgi:hypothetical protein